MARITIDIDAAREALQPLGSGARHALGLLNALEALASVGVSLEVEADEPEKPKRSRKAK
uniref:Uncharacterized protein n=1 Tax=viral metagenome TaxID=1070528 RepID=A0A6H1ZN69_9ZZZZ